MKNNHVLVNKSFHSVLKMKTLSIITCNLEILSVGKYQTFFILSGYCYVTLVPANFKKKVL